MRGRKPIPIAVHLLRGTTPQGRVVVNDNRFETPLRMPSPPDGMGADGAWLWRRAGKMLIDAGIYTEADYLALELMCSAWGRMKEAERLMAIDGMQLTTNGGSYLNPYMAIVNRSWKQVKAMLKEFGLTPAEYRGLFRG